MAKEKLVDTEYKEVVITYRDVTEETTHVNIAGNNVVEDGKLVLKQYKIQTGKPVSLPVTFIKELKDRYYVAQRKDKTTIHIPILNIEYV